MCDYSLMTVPNRLAQEGEELVTHRFPTGSLGLASPNDLKCSRPVRAKKTIWGSLKDFFDPPPEADVCAVCIPPGAKLRLDAGKGPEEVTFTQISAAVNTYRDAVEFHDGRQIRLQEFREGLRVTVLDLSGASVPEPVIEFPLTTPRR